MLSNSIGIPIDQMLASVVRVFALVPDPTSADFMRDLYGGPFRRDVGTSVRRSQRAQFARWLSKNRHRLGIEVAVKRMRIKDDDGCWTTAASWVRRRLE